MPTGRQLTLLPDASIEAIIRGDYLDIFAVLGMQDYSADKKQLSVFLPGAEQVTVVSRKKPIKPCSSWTGSMQRVCLVDC